MPRVKSHVTFDNTSAVIAELRNMQEYKSAELCVVIEDDSTRDIINAMKLDGKDIYRITCGRRFIYSPDGERYRKTGVSNIKFPKADILVSGCKWYHPCGAVFTNYRVTKDFTADLKYRKLIHEDTVKIAVASTDQVKGVYKDSSRLFHADNIITPEKGTMVFPRVSTTVQMHVTVPQ